MTDRREPAPQEAPLVRDEALWQLFSVVAVVVAAPLAVAVAAATLLVATVTRARWWWALLPAAVGAGWTLLAGLDQVIAQHVAVYEAAADAAIDLPEVAATQWASWLSALVPLSLTAGGLAAAALLAYLRWRRPDWRTEHDRRDEARAKPRRARRRTERLRQGRPAQPATPASRLRRRRHETPMVTLGVDQGGEPVELGRTQLAEHVLLVGATGSGKTTTQLQLCAGAIRHGHPAVLIDLKGDPAVTDQLQREAHAAGRPFYGWGLDGPTRWSPLRHGDASRLKDKLLAAEEWTEPHYHRAAERYVQLVCRALSASGQPPSLPHVVELMDPRRLQVLTRDLPHDLAIHLDDYLDGLTRDQQSGISGAQSRLALLTESLAGPWLDDPDGGGLDLADALREQAVVCFSLPAGDYPSLAALIGGMAIIDLQTVAAERQRDGWDGQAFAAIDEFSALDGTHVLGLLARGRSAGMSVLLATQELADLQTSRPEFAGQVLANTATKLAHRVDVPDSAEQLAALAGTQRTWEATHQVHEHTRRARADQGTGLGSMRQVDEYVVHPNTIKTLPRGRAVLIAKQPTADMRLVDVVPTPTLTPTTAVEPGDRGGHIGPSDGEAVDHHPPTGTEPDDTPAPSEGAADDDVDTTTDNGTDRCEDTACEEATP